MNNQLNCLLLLVTKYTSHIDSFLTFFIYKRATLCPTYLHRKDKGRVAWEPPKPLIFSVSIVKCSAPLSFIQRLKCLKNISLTMICEIKEKIKNNLLKEETIYTATE
jgi:hypothetical protein